MAETSLADRARDQLPDVLARRFGIDPRGLAALRISLAVLLLVDLVVRAPDAVAFYTDDGVLPPAALFEVYPGLGRLSIHALSGSVWFQLVLFGTAGAFAVALAIGYRTPLVATVSLLLLVSLHLRNPVLLNAGDAVFRRLLFWGLFLPLGGRWSVDALRRGSVQERVAGVASAALLLQVVLVYTVNGVIKLRGEHWHRGDAVRYVFGLDQLTVYLGDTLARFPLLLEAFNWLWLVLVLSSVFLLLSTGRTRTLLVGLFAVTHLGMLLTMRLGLFPLISIAGLVPFLPPPVWDAVERRVTPVLRTVESSSTPSVSGLRFEGRWPARTDRRSRSTACTDRLVPPVVAVLLVVVLVWNATTLGYVSAPAAVSASVDPEEFRWDMFAPDPRTNDGWYVVPGELESGSQVDAFRGTSVDWDRPPDLAGTFPGHRWFVYLLDLQSPAYTDLWPYFGDYLCREWNADHRDELVELTVYYMEERVRLDEPREPRAVEIHQHTC